MLEDLVVAVIAYLCAYIIIAQWKKVVNSIEHCAQVFRHRFNKEYRNKEEEGKKD